ncbi:MAG TPA: sulfite exporter TauE/SafE family protein [Bauldia sp.]|nr:sulfite exporter TauE/SafE family protein [Bauldia sp.]
MDLTLLQAGLAALSGAAVGFSLGLVGGGGSILAVPLLYYVVGIGSPHLAIGTSSVAVAASAAMGLANHARAGTVKWPCAIAFAVAGVVGAAIGAEFGKAIDGHLLLGLFGLLMIAIGASMLLPRRGGERPEVQLNRASARRLLPVLVIAGLIVGFASGFFGIGGGFLIVPGLVAATAMPIVNAIGSSLVSVTAFGATTAVSYALSGFVDWAVALIFIAGGIVGTIAGTRLSHSLAGRGRTLTFIFAGIVIVAGIYVALRAFMQVGG